METVRRGKEGEVLTLSAYIKFEGTADYKKWEISPVCRGCYNIVHPTNTKAAIGFSDMGKILSGRSPPRPGFSHFDGEGKGCPYVVADNSFSGFANNEFDQKVRWENYAILCRDENRRRNRLLFSFFVQQSTGKTMLEENDLNSIWRTTKLRINTMIAMGKYPWLLSYALIIMAGERNKLDEHTSHMERLVYRPYGTQKLLYTGLDGSSKTAQVPKRVALYSINEINGQKSYALIEKFLVSEEEANRLAEIARKYNTQRPAVFFSQSTVGRAPL